MANKGVKIFLIVVLTIIAIILINFMIVKIADKEAKISIFSIGNKTEKIFENEYDIDKIKNIEVNASSSNVKFVEGKENKIKITAYGAKDERINVKKEEDTLNIQKENVLHIFMFFCWYKEEIIVELPRDFEENIKINVSSGNIETCDLENAKLDLKASSGNIHSGNMKDGNITTSSGNIKVGSGNQVNLKASSGNILAEDIKEGAVQTSSGNISIRGIEEGEVKATSGNIKIENSKKITVTLTSGTINIGTIDGFCELSAKSGGIKIENINITENSSIRATSGSVRIRNAGDMFINAKTTSGGIDVNNNNRKSDVELNIQTTSGGIKVNKNN